MQKSEAQDLVKKPIESLEAEALDTQKKRTENECGDAVVDKSRYLSGSPFAHVPHVLISIMLSGEYVYTVGIPTSNLFPRAVRAVVLVVPVSLSDLLERPLTATTEIPIVQWHSRGCSEL
jgi:hypothetical protein